MLLQNNSYFCGPVAISNALRCFGRKVSVERAAKLAGTSTEGTYEDGIVRALRHLGCTANEFEADDPKQALRYLTFTHQSLGHPIILLVSNCTHWLTVIGSVDENRRFVVVDSANVTENGTQIMNAKTLLDLWKARQKDFSPFYGIIVGR